MYKFKITYSNGTKEIIRASSPKHAESLAVKGSVSFIKWIR